MRGERPRKTRSLAVAALASVLLTVNQSHALSELGLLRPDGSGAWDGHQAVPTNAKLWVRVCMFNLQLGFPKKLLLSDPAIDPSGLQQLALIATESNQHVPGKIVLESRIQRTKRGLTPEPFEPTFRVEPDKPLQPNTSYRIEFYTNPYAPDFDVKVHTSIVSSFRTADGPTRPTATQWEGATQFGSEKTGSGEPQWLQLSPADALAPVFMVTPSSSLWPWSDINSSDVMFTTADGKLSTAGNCRPRFKGQGDEYYMKLEPFDALGQPQSPRWVAVIDGDVHTYTKAQLELRLWGLAAATLVLFGSAAFWMFKRRR